MIEKNETIYYIKGLSIISVISAHCNSVLDRTAFFPNQCSLILQNIGTLGVICFFVISGMLFHYKKGKMLSFFKKKLMLIGVPWLISATCIYIYIYIRKPPISFWGWANFVIGNGSYCYYLTILISFYLIFSLLFFMRTTIAVVICEVITVVSTIWFYDIGGLSPYLNIFNWIGYFALGLHISYYKEKFAYVYSKFQPLLKKNVLIFFFVLTVQLWRGSGGGYWNGLNVIVCWLGAITLTAIAILIERYQIPVLAKIIRTCGKISFFIYLWHMPFAGIVARVMNASILINLVLLRPVIVLMFTVIFYVIIKKISIKFHLDKIVPFIGIK